MEINLMIQTYFVFALNISVGVNIINDKLN